MKGDDSKNRQDDPHTEPQQRFTPEELRKAERIQIILYIVMGVFILLPFVVLWLRK